MDLNNLGGFAILGTIAATITAAWSQVKSVGHRVVGLIFWRSEVDWVTHRAVVSYLYRHERLWGNRDRQYVSASCSIDAKVFYQVLERIGEKSLVFYGKLGVIFVSPNNQAPQSPGDMANARNSPNTSSSFGPASASFSLTGFRWFGLSPDVLIATAMENIEKFEEQYEQKIRATNDFESRWVGVTKMVADHRGDCMVTQSCYRTGGTNWLTGDLRLLRSIPSSVSPTAVIDPVMKELVTEAKLWKQKRDWYRRVGLSWRRGWLLCGPPGGGKTKVAEIIAHELNVRLVDLSLAGMSDSGFRYAWNSLEGEDCRVVLIEELDTVFHGRTLQTGAQDPVPIGTVIARNYSSAPMGDGLMPQPLRFETILTTLSGARSKCDGTFLIITTNHPELIDPALGGWHGQDKPENMDELRRPGRIDRVIEIGFA